MTTGETVEKKFRWLATWNVLMVLLIVAGVFDFIPGLRRESGIMRASAIQLVNANGGVVGEFAVRDGTPGVYLDDEAGKTRLALYHSPEGTGLYIMDANGVTRIGIAQFAHGGGGVALHGPESRGAAVLYYRDEGSLRFFDRDGAVTNLVPAQGPQKEQ